MPVVVPILRLSVLFLNVWETYKAYKPPRPSSRNNGKPSARAMTQRKRNMKGCLAVWIVWCCFALYEGTLDGIVGIFIPFYEEIKALLLLFMLLTRARGAEPIYLHVIRPLLKPYAPLLDSMLEAAALFGGLLIMLVSIPVQSVTSWWKGSKASSHFEETLQPDSDVSSLNLNGYDLGGPEPSPPLNSRVALQEGGGARPPYSRNNTIRATQSNGYPSMYSTGNSGGTGGIGGQPRSYPQTRMSSASSTSYQIWHPPPAYDEDVSSFNGAPTTDGVSNHEEHDDEWRKYPAFPSAYPATPMTTSSRLPPKPTSTANHYPEDDDWRQYPPIPSAYPATPLTTRSKLLASSCGRPTTEGIPEESSEAMDADGSGQGFDQSLKQAQNIHPSSDGGLSDNVKMTGVQELNDNGLGVSDNPTVSESQDETLVSDQSSSSEESEYGIEEDSFDISFRTPRPLRHAAKKGKDDPQATVKARDQPANRPVSVALTTSSSYQSQSTALSTTDYGSSLRTAISRSPSRSSVYSSSSDVASAAGRKRTRGLNEIPEVINTTASESDIGHDAGDSVKKDMLNKTRGSVLRKTSSLKAGSRTLRPPVARVRPKLSSELFTDGEGEGDDELGTTDSEGRAVRPGAKRRKVVSPEGETKPVQERRMGLRPKSSTSETEQRHTRSTTSRVRKRPDVQVSVVRKPATTLAIKTKPASAEATHKVNNVWK